MRGYISYLHWVMPQCTYLLYTIFIPYMESKNWVNVKNLTSCVFPNGISAVTSLYFYIIYSSSGYHMVINGN